MAENHANDCHYLMKGDDEETCIDGLNTPNKHQNEEFWKKKTSRWEEGSSLRRMLKVFIFVIVLLFVTNLVYEQTKENSKKLDDLSLATIQHGESSSADEENEVVAAANDEGLHQETSGNGNKADLLQMNVANETTKMLTARQTIDSALKALQRDVGPEYASELFGSLRFWNRRYIKQKLIRALLGQNGCPGKAQSDHDFIMSFAGTSVTAGHDNYFNESYPIVLERLLLDSYTAAGLNLEVRNHAMGFNPAIPAAFCVRSQLGEDTDVAAWEFEMSISGPLKNAYVEEWMRNALYLPKRPALLMLNGGGGSRKPASDEDILEPRTGPPPLYGYGGDKGDLFEYYDAFGVHSQAMHEAVWKLDHLDKFNFHALVQAGKSTPKPAKWHPGPGGHLLRAQILAHHYLRLLDEAIISVLAALHGENTMPKLETLLETTTPLEQDPTVNEFKLPPPLYCDDFFCGSPASCAMTFKPIAQGSLLELVVSPPELKTAKPTIESQNNSMWHTQLITYDQNAVVNARNRGAQYLDMKYVLQGNKYAGPLVLGVETHNKHHMLFCQPPGSGENQAPIGRNSSILVDGKDSPFELEDSFYLTHTIRAPCWATKHQLEPGNHTITITPTNADGKYISLSAVIWF
ncbi:hypothetical protein NSK_007073 [Nannochloropsis salina CCMP1776]|jgi:hypothetical protein|uniref:Uncharacterized protein n=1 Tax=Nannochloropsis salina CCMP1776 TaxID=1027361 RepID=A0A4D9CSM2_9STRA|nr:hypothetical protein NSK_007073 [Nannochloropsis salina CCMP1776]|eukprot:TFJ81826.1 hypothetical protein NSK_007073 [Nannochloropsis salina CCMP1776]